VYRLHEVIERLARGASRAESGFDPIQPVRARAHLELARIGSRVAAADLRHWLADADQRLELEMLEALERIGKRDEIPYLLRAWTREDRLGRERIAQVVRSIMKRERIRRADPTFMALGARDRRALATILDAPSLTRSRGGC
jgi:hypothetical protein